MSEQIREEWIILREVARMDHIVAISNRGNVRYGSGDVQPAKMYARVKLNGKVISVANLIAERFIGKTDEDVRLGRNTVDHITHNPENMLVNDVRNLRWCTRKENSNFPEAKRNMHVGVYGKGKTEFGKWFLENFPGDLHENMNEYVYYRNRYLKTGELPTVLDYDKRYGGPHSEFAAWFNSRYGSGNKNPALYKRCYRHYKATGNFLEV